MLRTATSLMTNTHMFVAVGRGARLGQPASRAATCLNVTFTGTAHAPMLMLARPLAPMMLTDAEVAIHHLVQVRPLVVETVLIVEAVVEVAAARLAAF